MKLLKDKRVVMTVLSIILVLVVMSSTTYALFFKVHTMENVESYTAGILEITVEEGTALTLNNTLPMTDEEGASLTPYTFTVTNTGNLAYTFDLKILSTTTSNQINPAYIKVKLDDNQPVILSSLSEGLIANDLTLNPSDSVTMSIRIWLDINTPNTEIGKNFSAKIVTDGVGSEYVPSQDLLLDISKGAVSIDVGSDNTKLYVTGGGLPDQIEIDKTKSIIISGSDTGNGGITVNGCEANITLKNLSIISSKGTFRLLNDSIVNLTIEGENTLDASDGSSVASLGQGISVPQGTTLIINGTGTLNATGTNCAIGSALHVMAGTIIINGGTINANSAHKGAGIGGSDLELIEINGGTINASGGKGETYYENYYFEGGAGIGGSGFSSVTGNIRINGGNIYAKGGFGAAGIGGGGPEYMGSDYMTAPNIYVSDDANVTAIAGIWEFSGDVIQVIQPENIGNGGLIV